MIRAEERLFLERKLIEEKTLTQFNLYHGEVTDNRPTVYVSRVELVVVGFAAQY